MELPKEIQGTTRLQRRRFGPILLPSPRAKGNSGVFGWALQIEFPAFNKERGEWTHWSW
jgi:hypothetical protein